jgi:hypothetical protein
MCPGAPEKSSRVALFTVYLVVCVLCTQRVEEEYYRPTTTTTKSVQWSKMSVSQWASPAPQFNTALRNIHSKKAKTQHLMTDQNCTKNCHHARSKATIQSACYEIVRTVGRHHFCLRLTVNDWWKIGYDDHLVIIYGKIARRYIRWKELSWGNDIDLERCLGKT